MLIKAAFAIAMLFWLFATPASAATAAHDVLLLPIQGVIHGGTVEIVKQAQTRAAQEFQALLIELDTPGGMLDATRELVKLMLNAEVPIIVYVSPGGSRAGSAGTFITLAAHIAAMAPGTNIGAAHPISVTGKDPEEEGGEHLAKKIENDTLAFIETIATQRGRNVEWAKKAVQESSSITESKALELKVIDLIAKNRRDLLRQLDGRLVTTLSGTVTLNTTESNWVQMKFPFALRVLNVLASPTTMFLLMIIFVLGIYVEFSHPGLIFPAIGSLIAAVFLLFASRVLPINYLGALLILVAAVFLVAELYVTSFGLLTVGGLVCFFFGSMMLFDRSQTDVRVPLAYIIGATSAVGIIALAVGYLVTKSLMLPSVAGREGMIGDIGTVLEHDVARGKLRVFVDGEYWQARFAGNDALQVGDKMKVVGMEGLTLIVEKV